MQISISECVCGSIFIYLFLSVSTSLSVSLSSICSISMWWASKNCSEFSLFPNNFPVIKIIIAYLKCMSWENTYRVICFRLRFARSNWLKSANFVLYRVVNWHSYHQHPISECIFDGQIEGTFIKIDMRKSYLHLIPEMASDVRLTIWPVSAISEKKWHGSVAVGNHHWPDINENNWLVLLIWRNMFWQKKNANVCTKYFIHNSELYPEKRKWTVGQLDQNGKQFDSERSKKKPSIRQHGWCSRFVQQKI